MKVEAGPETSVFRMWGSLRRVDALGNKIDYSTPIPISPVETDASIESDGNPHLNGFHPNGVKGTGVSIELLTGSRI